MSDICVDKWIPVGQVGETDFMRLAVKVSELSSCKRKKTGAVIIDQFTDKFTFGYNHMPLMVSREICDRCPRENKQPGQWTNNEECPVIHAEVAAILRAANVGVRTFNAYMYCTYKPCMRCAMAIVEAGIRKVFYLDWYPGGDDVEKYLGSCGVEAIRCCPEKDIENQSPTN